jgi:phage baseplate assembly protein W
MRPNFGTLIPYTLFNSETEATAQIQSEVEKAFAQQLDLLTLQQTIVTSDIYTSTLTVEVIYGLPNDEVTSTLIGLVFSQGANPIYEELL